MGKVKIKFTVQEELQILQKKNKGFLDPVKVVEYARDPKTALHSKFEWDDDKAAEQYRIQQARKIIRLELTVISEYDENQEVRCFVSLKKDRKADKHKGYRMMVNVLSDKNLREQLFEEAKNELMTFKQKFGLCKELKKVFDAIDDLD